MSPLKSFINRITGNTSVKTEPLNYNACPACLEPIPNSFSERHCNNCHYIFSQFPLEIAKFYLDWEYFTYKGKEYKYEEIIRLYVCTKKTVYLLKETSECKVI